MSKYNVSTAARRHLVQSAVKYSAPKERIKDFRYLTQKAAEGSALRDIYWRVPT